MSAQCQHGILRYECLKCYRARKKREAGMDYNELVRRLRSGCAPDVCPSERDEAADAIVELQARVAELEAERDSFYMRYRMDSDVTSKAAIVRAERAEADLAAARATNEELRQTCAHWRSMCERGNDNLAAARVDAERYRWLKKTNAYHLLSIAWISPAAQKVGADCDKAIDAALAGEKK